MLDNLNEWFAGLRKAAQEDNSDLVLLKKEERRALFAVIDRELAKRQKVSQSDSTE